VCSRIPALIFHLVSEQSLPARPEQEELFLIRYYPIMVLSMNKAFALLHENISLQEIGEETF
jgi:hypothetical protein